MFLCKSPLHFCNDQAFFTKYSLTIMLHFCITFLTKSVSKLSVLYNRSGKVKKPVFKIKSVNKFQSKFQTSTLQLFTKTYLGLSIF